MKCWVYKVDVVLGLKYWICMFQPKTSFILQTQHFTPKLIQILAYKSIISVPKLHIFYKPNISPQTDSNPHIQTQHFSFKTASNLQTQHLLLKLIQIPTYKPNISTPNICILEVVMGSERRRGSEVRAKFWRWILGEMLQR